MCVFQPLSNVTGNAGEVKLGVMEGRDCFDLICLGFSSVFDTGGVSFLTEAGSSYYVAVAVPPWSSEGGSFTLTAEVCCSVFTLLAFVVLQLRSCACNLHLTRTHLPAQHPQRTIPAKSQRTFPLCLRLSVERSIWQGLTNPVRGDPHILRHCFTPTTPTSTMRMKTKTSNNILTMTTTTITGSTKNKRVAISTEVR